MFGLLRIMLAATILMIGAVTPVMACPVTDAGMTKAGMMDGGRDHGQAMPTMGCDMACLACLVQPEPARVAVVTGWSMAMIFPRVTEGSPAVNVAPDVPPPRIGMA